MTQRTLPSVFCLTRGQRSGQRCVWCGRGLDDASAPAGIARGYWGAHDLSVPVWACPECATTEETTR